MIYLTGAPATGKSTLTIALKSHIADLQILEFGARLTARLALSGHVSELADLRSQSALLITLKTFGRWDHELLEFVAANRETHPVIIDSHAVTKESYGTKTTATLSCSMVRLASKLALAGMEGTGWKR